MIKIRQHGQKIFKNRFKKKYKLLQVSPSPMATDTCTYWTILINSVMKNTVGELFDGNKNIFDI